MSRGLDQIETFQRMIPIQKHRLDDELEIQAEMMYHISEARTRAASAMHKAKDLLSTTEARVYLKVRAEGEKMTAAETDGHVQQDRSRSVAWLDYQAARHELERWEGLFESWKQRGFALKTLADLYMGNYFTINGAGNPRGGSGGYESTRQQIAEVRSSSAAPATVRRRTII